MRAIPAAAAPALGDVRVQLSRVNSAIESSSDGLPGVSIDTPVLLNGQARVNVTHASERNANLTFTMQNAKAGLNTCMLSG